MLVRLPPEQEEYVNIISLTAMFIATEFLVAMETICLYNRSTEIRKWNIRRLFWYITLGVPTLSIIAIFTMAAIKVILQ